MDYPTVVSLVYFLLFHVVPILAIAVLTMTTYSRIKTNGLNLPPGANGFPLIGETIQFVKPYPVNSVGKFVEERVQKYGKIFRTNLMGNPTVVSTDPEFIEFFVKNDGKLFETNLPRSFHEIFGADVIAMRKNRGLMSALHEFLSVRHVRTIYLQDYDRLALQFLRSWKEGVELSAFMEVSKVSFNLMLNSMFSFNLNNETREMLYKLYKVFAQGVKTFPLNFPGTSFRKGMKARDAIAKILQKMIEERAKLRHINDDNFMHENPDYLSKLLEIPGITIQQITGHMLGVIYGGHESVSVSICLAIYYLASCPKAVKQLQEEHVEIARTKRMKGELSLTWEDIKQMEFTQQVIKEILRLGNVISFVSRKATTDIKFKGYDIPRGWGVLTIISSSHLDAEVYKEPLNFNPWRWQDDKNLAQMMERYIPFNRGVYKCTGHELAKMELSVFLHHFVTMYDWELTELDLPVSTFSMGGFPKGLPLKVYSRVE